MRQRASILIVSNGALCRNPRTLKEATTLGNAGYSVTVLTVRNHGASEAIDVELTRGASWRRELVDLLVPGVRTLGTRACTWWARKAARWCRWQSPTALGPYRGLLRRARSLPADLTIVHNEVAHCVGLKLLGEGRRVAADFEDWHSEDLLPADRAHRPLGLLRANERALLQRAVHVTTTSSALADAMHARYGGRRPVVITNSFPISAAPTPRSLATPPKLLWFSQTVGRGRGLEPFIRTWNLTQHPSELIVVGETSPEYRAELLGLVSSRGPGITFLPAVPPDELPALIARHDVGLALEDGSIRNRDLTITNKILQYLNGGLAVVASDTAGHREVLAREPECGLILPLNDPAVAARQLDRLLANRAEIEPRQLAARRLAERVYCWEREAPRLLAVVETSLAANP